MTHVIGGMTVSLDGFFEDAKGSISALYTDFDDLRDSAYMKAARAETGAALMGRRFFDMTPDPDVYADGYEFQVPIVVVTHRLPERQPKRNDQLFSQNKPGIKGSEEINDAFGFKLPAS